MTTTGFVGPTRFGPLDIEPDIITSLVEFERTYGGKERLQFIPDGGGTPVEVDNFMWHAARAFFGIYTFVLFLGALIVLLPGLGLTGVIVGSQNLQGLLLPFVLVFLVLLVNDRSLMGRHANGRIANVLAWAAVGVVVVLDVVLLAVTLLGAVGVKVG